MSKFERNSKHGKGFLQFEMSVQLQLESCSALSKFIVSLRIISRVSLVRSWSGWLCGISKSSPKPLSREFLTEGGTYQLITLRDFISISAKKTNYCWSKGCATVGVLSDPTSKSETIVAVFKNSLVVLWLKMTLQTNMPKDHSGGCVEISESLYTTTTSNKNSTNQPKGK